MPAPSKSFEAFQADQAACKTFAESQITGQAEAANNRAIGAAVVTTLLGAGLGAAAGGFGHSAGSGAAIGAAAGAGLGGGLGAGNSARAQVGIQIQYNNAYVQCMYAKGELVPGYVPPPNSPSPPAPVASAPVPRAPVAGAPVPSGLDSALVRSVQAELIRLDYLGGEPDGEMGPRTSAAIRDYQRASGQPVDGGLSPRLLAALQSTPSSRATATPPPNAWVAPAGAPTAAPAAASPPATTWIAPTTPQ